MFGSSIAFRAAQRFFGFYSNVRYASEHNSFFKQTTWYFRAKRLRMEQPDSFNTGKKIWLRENYQDKRSISYSMHCLFHNHRK